MSINCEVILKDTATPDQLKEVGVSLWRWCIHAAPKSGIYQFLDNHALADLIAGEFPASTRGDRESGHLWIQDETSQDPKATIDSLRREMPLAGVKDIVVDGASWNGADQDQAPTADGEEQDWWPSRLRGVPPES